MRLFFQTISIIFHPLLMPTYGCLLLFFLKPNTPFDLLTPLKIKWLITGMVFLFTFLFPAFNILTLYKMKRISSIRLNEQNERTFPYVLTALFYLGLFYMLRDIQLWNSIKLLILGAGLSILTAALINLKYKISAHAIGIGGLLGGMIAVSYFIQTNFTLYYIVIILIGGMVGSGRLYLKEHTGGQITLGFITGFTIQFITFTVLHNLAFNG